VEVRWIVDTTFVAVPVSDVPWRMESELMPRAPKFAAKISPPVPILAIDGVILVAIVDYVNNAANYNAFILDAPEPAEQTAYPVPNLVPRPANISAPATCRVELPAIVSLAISDVLAF